MNITSFAFRPAWVTAFLTAAALASAALAGTALLAGCSQGKPSSMSSGSLAAPRPAGAPGLSRPAGQPYGAQAPRRYTGSARLTLAVPSIIYTASLAVRARDVAAAASQAAAIAGAAGGYVSSQQESVQPGKHAASVASLQLKIPVTAYPAALTTLSAKLGTLVSLSRQATDVTQQVADVNSRVASAKAAIAQLRALLGRAGSVSGLLTVQEQINAQESALEALQAQQRALAGQTAYATVSLLLLSQHHKVPAHKKSSRRGFLAGLSGGWRALRLAVTGVLTALGAAAPFLAIAAVAGGIGYVFRRRLLRRRSGPTATA